MNGSEAETRPTPWRAERVVTADDALALVREQFPALRGREIEPFGSGWDNTAFLVDGEWVFRFPRRQIAVELIETEVRVLPRLAPHLPLAIPVPVHVGEPTERFPWPFAGYRKLHGRTACSVDWTTDERRAAAEPLARFLRALHSIDTDGLGLPPDYIHRTDMAARRAEFETRVHALQSDGVIGDGGPLLRLFDRDDFPAPAAQAVPVQGDLYERHVLVDEQHRPTGIIDWGDVHAGDAAIDLSLVYRFWPPDERDAFWRVYGSVDERPATLARLRAAFHAVATATFARDVGDDALLRTALTAMRHVVQE